MRLWLLQTTNRLRGWEGWTSDGIELHLQTRFAQLEVAAGLELWTEGFRTVEDIYNIMQVWCGVTNEKRRFVCRVGSGVSKREGHVLPDGPCATTGWFHGRCMGYDTPKA